MAQCGNALKSNILSDESRAGRPKSVVVPEKINAVRELIKQDRHVTYREIEASLDISMTSINKILHEHLSVKKICSRWIPHNLTNAQKKARVDWCKEMLEKYIQGTSKAVYNIYTGDESWIYSYEPETKQQSTVWVFQDEAKPTKVVRGRSTSKQMIACFFGINGHVATVALEQRRTVNSEWYTTICLPEVIGEIRKKQKNRRIILHHDNASSHTSTQTKAFLTERKIELMGKGGLYRLELMRKLSRLRESAVRICGGLIAAVFGPFIGHPKSTSVAVLRSVSSTPLLILHSFSFFALVFGFISGQGIEGFVNCCSEKGISPELSVRFETCNKFWVPKLNFCPQT
ncbi:HTH_48 domain-containing protein [Nephila pilipes]|uniref:HTH_48 domain-containing protein n=1 Tax=Nephila pilipes TaxID=299642 RepID=A0A8X6R564_NEPPI|nr:HTH_48 domain-containing protein [Nephila pilipes]